MNTPIAQFIHEILKEKRSFGWDHYTHNMLNDLIEIGKVLLDNERNEIINAYAAGDDDGMASLIRGTNYYNKKFMNHESKDVSC